MTHTGDAATGVMVFGDLVWGCRLSVPGRVGSEHLAFTLESRQKLPAVAPAVPGP
jgi:hypothetical protein